SSVELARCEYESARAHLMLGDVSSALVLARSGLARLDEGHGIDVCDGEILLGDTALVRGDVAGATQAYRRAARSLGALAAGRRAAGAWRALGDRMIELGEPGEAARAYAAALALTGIRPTTYPMIGRRARLGDVVAPATG
ncbi:MAG TPA: hypothetical protein VN257_11520, partial [Actinotalea sp.]|nr:hypothetical protein [Actinotalea sp.]